MILDGMLYFAENMGQTKNGCRYILEQSYYRVMFYDHKVDIILYGEKEDDTFTLPLELRDTDTYEEQNEMFLEARDKMNITINYMDGDKDHWIKNVPAYERLCYHDVCDGIDVEFYIQDGVLKQDFIVIREENLPDLKLKFQGQQDLYRKEDGTVILVGQENTFELITPYNYFS